MAIVDVVINLCYPVVLCVGANHTQNNSIWVRSVISGEQRFTRTRSIIRWRDRARCGIEPRDLCTERTDDLGRRGGCRVESVDVGAGIRQTSPTVASSKGRAPVGGSESGRYGNCDRGCCVESATRAIALTLVVHKIEQFIFLDRSAKAGAVLLQIDGGLWQRRRVEGVPSIEGSRSSKKERRTVHRVATGLYAGVDDGAGFPAIFRFRILLGIKFLNGVDRQRRRRIASGDGRVENARARVRIIFPHAVQQIANVLRAGSIGGAGGASATGVNRHARTQGKQVDVVAAIQGQVIDRLVA